MRSWVEVRKRFFANGVNPRGNRFPVVKREESTPFVFSDLAKAAGAVADEAPPCTEATFNLEFRLTFIKDGSVQ